ncbi:MAG: metallopeptidase family protein [Deltaproteobacteria bacterium]|nr:metallopeptidase family protein [Deltaproteobacteria bacterium]MBW2697199.1 metallopeptidase family protein [Deltaproteobacteria bacterium]
MKNDKDRYWDCLDQAMEASHGGRIEEALAWLEEALKAHPEGAEAHNGRGEILWDEARIDESLYEFERAVDADPKFSAAHLNRIELLVEELGEFELALEGCDALLAGREELPRLDRPFQAEVYYLKAKALFYLDDLRGAAFLIRRAIKSVGEQPTYSAFEGHVLFEMGSYKDARRVLERAAAADPDSPNIVYSLGLIMERLAHEGGEESQAENIEAAQRAAGLAFSRANAIDPMQFPVPVTVSDEFFREAVSEALDNLPRSIRDYIADVPVIVEDFPAFDLVAHERVSPQILGIFIGVPRTEASVTDRVPDLDRIILFKRNLEKICRDREELIEQIQITVRHEIGHYLGLDENDLDRLGLA